MKRWLFLLFLFILLPASAIMAQVTVKGVVIDEQKEPLIGVSVAVRGSTLGVTTDLDGRYSITVPDGSILTFEYLSMTTQTFTITPKITRLDVVMKSDAQLIEEVVVTAMGVKAEKRKLNFAVSSVNSDDILASKPSNFVEALQGRVAGINITSQGGSPNAGTQMQIRSIASMNTSQSNEPLFVIDGMSLSAGSGGMAQLNPSDIENITVLKGAAASALYGSAGANGVIMITTKAGKKGKTTVNFTNSIQIDNVYRLPKIQNKWMPGANGITTNKYGTGGWGAEIADGTKTYDNAKNFFETGVLHKHDVSVSTSGESFSAFGSMNYSSQEGVIPNDYLDKMNVYLKAVFDVSPTFSMSFMTNIYSSKSRDASTSASTTYSSYLGTVYSWPIINDMRNYKQPNGELTWLYDDEFYTPDSEIYKGDWVVNPYVRRLEDYQKRESTNNIAQTTATWKAFKNFELTGRVGYEFSNSITDAYTIPRFLRSDLSAADLEKVSDTDVFGTYDIRDSRSSNYTFNTMARYNYELNKDFTFEFMLGTEMKISKTMSGLKGGSEFKIPGFYGIDNIVNANIPTDITATKTRKRKVGFFGEIRADYKGIASLSVTGRNDQSSTLIQTSKYSYFYPSVTGGFTFSELLNISNDVFSFGKVRANWAKVGKDLNAAYAFSKKYIQKPNLPDGGYGNNPTLATVLTDIEPEMMRSWEVGLDLRFFNSKTRLDFAYYSTSVDNQIVTVRTSPAAGTILQTINQGELENHGVEISLDQDIIRNKDFTWVANVNFTSNRSKVKYLPDGISQIENTSARAGNDLMSAASLGKSVTSIIGRDYERTEDGRILCNADGTPIINSSTTTVIGDREPDFRMGFGSTFAYKDWSLSFLFDLRKGGDVVNATARDLYSNGMAKRLEKYRNKEVVFDGVVEQADGTYVKNTIPIILNQTNITEYFVRASSNFIEDVSYLRLSHVTVGYNFKRLISKQNIIKDLNLSVTGRNLFLLTNYSGSDPQVNFDSSGGVGSMGIDNMNVPNTRSFNVTLSATF